MIWLMTSYGPLDVPPRSINQAIVPICHIQSNLWISFCHTQCWRNKVESAFSVKGWTERHVENREPKNLLVWNQIKVWGRATWSKDGHSWWCWELIASNVTNCIAYLKICRLHCAPTHDLQTGHIWLTCFLHSIHYWSHAFLRVDLSTITIWDISQTKCVTLLFLKNWKFWQYWVMTAGAF